MKKTTILALVVIISILSFSSLIEAYVDTITLQIDSYIAYVDGNEILLDAAPFVSEGRTMVPLRMIADAFGYETKWNAVTKKVTIISEETVIELAIGQSIAVVNGELIYIDGSPIISNGKTMVPIRVVSEIMGYLVDWNQATRIITIRVPPSQVTGGEATSSSTNKTEEITGVITIDLNELLAQQEATFVLKHESLIGNREGLHADIYRETITGGTYSMSIAKLEVAGGINPDYEKWINAEYEAKYHERAKAFLEANELSGTISNRLVINHTVYTNGKVLSILSEAYESHSPKDIEMSTRTFDVEVGVELELKDLFIDGVDGEELILKSLNQMTPQLASIYPEMSSLVIENVDKFVITNDKIIVYYAPYELTSTYGGIMQFQISYSSMSNYLKPEYFGDYVMLTTLAVRILYEGEQNVGTVDGIQNENDFTDERSVK